MKKIITLILIVAAVIACSKTDIEYTMSEEIQIVPVNENVTKSVMAGTKFMGQKFNLWAWYQETPAAADMIGTWQGGFAQGSTTPTIVYINEKPFEERDASRNLWGGVTPYFWPKTGSLIFAGYHAPDLTEEDDVTYSFDATNNHMSFNDVQQQKMSAEGYNEDIMYFNMTTSSYNSKSGEVNLAFKHAMTWITVTVCKKANPEIPATIYMHDVYFTDVKPQGDGTVENQDNIVWTAEGTAADLNVLTGGNVELKYNITGTDGNRTIESVIETLDEYIIVPQAISGYLKVRYTVESTDGSNFTETYTVDLRSLKENTQTAWEPGKHYTYNLQIGTDELLVSPVVTEWEKVDTSILIPLPEVTPGQPGV